jgi:hypothetical protein
MEAPTLRPRYFATQQKMLSCRPTSARSCISCFSLEKLRRYRDTIYWPQLSLYLYPAAPLAASQNPQGINSLSKTPYIEIQKHRFNTLAKVSKRIHDTIKETKQTNLRRRTHFHRSLRTISRSKPSQSSWMHLALKRVHQQLQPTYDLRGGSLKH